MKLKDFSKAHQDFDMIISIVPENPEFLSIKAQCFLSEGPSEDHTLNAIKLLEKALELDEMHIESIELIS